MACVRHLQVLSADVKRPIQVWICLQAKRRNRWYSVPFVISKDGPRLWEFPLPTLLCPFMSSFKWCPCCYFCFIFSLVLCPSFNPAALKCPDFIVTALLKAGFGTWGDLAFAVIISELCSPTVEDTAAQTPASRALLITEK